MTMLIQKICDHSLKFFYGGSSSFHLYPLANLCVYLLKYSVLKLNVGTQFKNYLKPERFTRHFVPIQIPILNKH